MANSRGASTTRNTMYKLPPKSPFPIIAPPSSYSSDYIPTCAIAPKVYRDGNSHHQRASSETTLVVEDQPSWLDELLNEPETPLQRGHRRSSSDSFTYLEAANAQDVVHPIRNLASSPSWGSKNVPYKDARNAAFYGEPNPLVKTKNCAWDLPQNSHSTRTTSSLDNMVLRRSASLGATQDLKGIASTRSEKQGAAESDPQISPETRPQDANTSSETNDFSSNNAFPSETDSKRAKQQFAQRSRVRKLQYIAELERNVQALQAEGGEVSAELEFLNQQSLILGLENKALKQRLENLAQEQLIKCLEHEVLEREMGRLQALYQQQQQRTLQQPQQAPQSHRRTASRDRLDFLFANLSLKNKESNPVHDPVSSQPRDRKQI